MRKNIIKSIFSLIARYAGKSGSNDGIKFVTFGFDAVDKNLNPEDKWRLRYSLFKHRSWDWPVVPASKQLRSYGFFKLVDELSGVEGDFVEAGVGYGNSLISLAYACAFFGVDKKIYGFDSFEGFPVPNAEDLGRRVKELNAPLSGWDDTSPRMIRQALAEGWNLDAENNAVRDRIQLVPGFFETTMPGQLPGKIAFLHVDCDLFEPVVHVLTHCIGRMSAGGVIVFDEYHDEKWPGVKKAVDKFCADHSLTIVYFKELQRYGFRIAK